MITPEELHEQIMEQIDLTKEVEDEELTRVIYEILRETEEQEYISLKEKTFLGNMFVWELVQ